jgi:hypothetical protein
MEQLAFYIDNYLSAWTALELGLNHYEGHPNEARELKNDLLSEIVHIVSTGQYNETDLAEHLADFLDERLHVDVGDNSHIEVSRMAFEACRLLHSGQVPRTVQRRGGNQSVIQGNIEEVSGDEDEEMNDDQMESGRDNQPRVVTDDDGWSTVVPRK